MVKINLATYSIYAYSKERDKKIKLNHLNDNTILQESSKFNTLNEILIEFFKQEKPFIEDKLLKFLRVKQYHDDSSKIFYGELEYGPFGTKHAVVNAENISEDEKIINPEDSVLTPYYFYIQLFENRHDGLLILETKSNSGIKIIFENWINEFLKKIRCTHFEIKLVSFLPEEVINQFATQGKIRKIRYLSYKLPTDITDNIDDYEPDEGYAEYTINIKKEKTKINTRILTTILTSKNNKDSLMKNIDFDVDDIKLEVELNDTKRTFTIGNLTKTQPARDITYELDIGEDGHRTFDSIHAKGSEYAKDIIEKSN